MVLEHACRVISEQYPELPFVTIHDSVVCDHEYAERVEQILKDTLQQNIGIIPGLKTELMNKHYVVQNIQQTVDDDWDDVVDELKKMREGQD